MKNFESDLLHAAELIAGADALVIASGAGMGVDSGLPDFRGNEVFWQTYPALAKANLNFIEVASPRTFEQDPNLAWGFYGHRLALYRETAPHPGYELLKRWGERMFHGYSVFTSNVDGQFQKAGFDPAHIHECHGSIHHLQCLQPCHDDVWVASGFLPGVDEKNCRLRNMAPICPQCGGFARPNILMFGDDGWLDRRSGSQGARQETWLSEVTRPVVIELGAGTAIPSVRHFSHRVIHEFGGVLIRVNPNECNVPTRLDVGLRLGALAGLTAIAQVLGSEWGSIDGEDDDGQR